MSRHVAVAEFFELFAARARKQFEMLNEQIKQISAPRSRKSGDGIRSAASGPVP